MLGEAERLVQAGVMREADDSFYLTFQEFRDAVRTNQVDDASHRASAKTRSGPMKRSRRRG